MENLSGILKILLGLMMTSTLSYALKNVTIEQSEYNSRPKTGAKKSSFPHSQENKSLIAAMKEKLIN